MASIIASWKYLQYTHLLSTLKKAFITYFQAIFVLKRNTSSYICIDAYIHTWHVWKNIQSISYTKYFPHSPRQRAISYPTQTPWDRMRQEQMPQMDYERIKPRNYTWRSHLSLLLEAIRRIYAGCSLSPSICLLLEVLPETLKWEVKFSGNCCKIMYVFQFFILQH